MPFWAQVGLFDLSTFGSGGVCHTYNPPRKVEPGVSGQFYAILGKNYFCSFSEMSMYIVYVYTDE